MSEPSTPPPRDVVGAEPVAPADPERLAHLALHRSLIVRRALLSTALGGFVPLPVMDELLASRVRAGLYMKLAAGRNVDLPQSAADVLADPRDGSTLRNATLIAATLIALKLAWRKFFALLAAGRGAEEMATTFQFATLVDHYCTRLHVGGPVSPTVAGELRTQLHAAIDRTEKEVLVTVFREGSRALGRSVLEAPRWLTERIAGYARRWAESGGRTIATGPDPAVDGRWLDRAARLVEERLGTLGLDYLGALVDRFEAGWKARPQGGAPVAASGAGEAAPH